MKEAQLTIFIDLKEGERIDLEVAAFAAVAWSRTIKHVGRQITPFHEWTVELEGARPGSQKIKAWLGIDGTADIKDLIRGAVINALILHGVIVYSWTIEQVLEYLRGPDAPEEAQQLSANDLHEIATQVSEMLGKNVGRKESEEIFLTLEKDESVTGVGATSHPDGKPETVLPRSRFPAVGGEIEKQDAETRTITDTAELILIRPVLANDPKRKWSFQSHYGTFGASIHDQIFLDSLSNGTLNIPMVEGIRMFVEIKILEEREGEVWRPKDRVITKVHDVFVPPLQDGFDLKGSE